MKVEGVLPADPNTVFQFLKISTKDGGKVSPWLLIIINNYSTSFIVSMFLMMMCIQLDYIFRNELLLQEFDGERLKLMYIANVIQWS